ncbi:transcription factor HHO2 isoform X2 [Spinacia oleracea]|uniref:Transcription factor HHO2 isoform X2 n=1 Tax=Spinacia oleracea TaxID=3562 RepID=A0A9R0IXB6_SPIOL|nr:transcription factor HHO2-like isoform X2 [Spinacia oleracea]
MMDFRDNMHKCQEYIHALEDERKKIQVFQRELPLCLDLVTQAIEACKRQLCGNGTTTTTTTECFNGHSECSEQTTSDGPILEEFIPLKRSNSPDDDDELESNKPQINNNDKSGKKSDWLRSVQLWNQTPDPPTTTQEPKKVAVVEVKRNGSVGGAFHPFQKEKNNNGDESDNNNTNNKNNSKKQATSTPAASACSTVQEEEMGPSSGGSGGSDGGGGGSSKKEKDAQSQRKARRCWSPELHRRFVHALQQLGGSHVATPKQIRDSMKVDGLTNDEVKSHLQKYRLHTRRPSSAHHNNGNQQSPQFVVVGGIWVPPEYAATTARDTTTTVAASGGIYAPIATVAAPPRPMHQTSTQRQSSDQSHCEERGSHSEGHVVHSNSPTTSSSTHTTTASHAQ